MTTTLYLVRHAEPNYENHNDAERELTAQGLTDSLKVTKFLLDKHVQHLYSSPYKRAIDTVKDFSEKASLPITTISDIRERKIDSVWIEDFESFTRKQWTDFSYRYSDGESLGQVQKRMVKAIRTLLAEHPDGIIAAASHGTALSTLVNYFQPSFGLADFQSIKHLFPFILKCSFEGEICTGITLYDILQEPVHETPLL